MKRVTGWALACWVVFCASAPLRGEATADEKSKGFLEDFAKAKREAAAFKQPIFALFTGSDWCPWCVKLHDEVLAQKEFATFAAMNLILFEADFPQMKKQSDDVRKQNAALALTYGVEGYPTVLLLDANGRQLGQLGYEPGGAAAYVKGVKALLEKAGIKVPGEAAEARPTPTEETTASARAAGKK